MQFGTLLLARLDVRHNTLPRSNAVIFITKRGEGGRTYVELELGDLWTLMDALGEGVTNVNQLDLLGEFGKEFIVDSRLDKDTSTSATSLAVVPTDRRSE